MTVGGPQLATLLEALRRGRPLLWTGHVLVELDAPLDRLGRPRGLESCQATMVLDEDDLAALERLASARLTSGPAGG